MKHLIFVLTFFIMHSSFGIPQHAQLHNLTVAGGPVRHASPSGGDTTCGIVWYPPIQLSAGATAVDEMNPSIAVQGDTVHVTWALSSQKFPYRRSVNGGQTFEPIRELAPDTTELAEKCVLLSTLQWVAGFWVSRPDDFGWVVRSTDGGTTWSAPQLVVDSLSGWLTAASIKDSIGMIIASNRRYRKMFVSTDRGSSWEVKSPEIIGNDPRIAMTPGAVHRVTYWGFDSSGVWSEFVVQYRKSTDLGETWSDSVNLSTMNTAAYEPAIAADGSGDSATVLTAWKDVKYGCLTDVGCSILGRFSKNSGSQFQLEERFDHRAAGAFARTAVLGNTFAVGWTDDMQDGGARITLSFDGGATWCPPVSVRDNGDMRGIGLSQNAIHVVYNELIGGPAGRWRVFYRRGVVLPTGVSEDGGTRPPFASLSQNYPNPFNPTTVIGYQLPTAGIVSLKVYDVLGREVQTLISERMDAGAHQAVWDAAGVPSGMYYYRLMLADAAGKVFTQTKKMVIIH